MKCSVVILNWNGANMLQQYLPSVVQYTPTDDCEIVVADNGSTDNSIALLEVNFPSVRVIQLDKNYGFADGYNRAISLIDSEYIILLNSDVEVTSHWLTPLINYMDAHADVAAVQPKIHCILRRTHFEHAGAAGGFLDRLYYPYCRGRILNTAEEDTGQYDTETDVLWTSGACMCVRTSVYNSEGGLDGDFFAHMEEIDFCWRLNSRGYRLVCIPDSTVYHLGGGALHYENPRKTYLNFRNNLLMIYKNIAANRLFGIMLCRFVLDYAAALQLLLTGKPRNAQAVLKARFDFMRMRSQFKQRRIENLEKTIIPHPKGITQRAILWDYYVRQKRS
ncbi:MAG: glycosyltransferase family 2 protein [Paludibacteraceae bacterium]